MKTLQLFDLDSERALIGAALIDPTVVTAVGHLPPEAFHDASHGLLWRAMQGLQGATFDTLQVKARAMELGGGERALACLREAEEASLSAANAHAYAQTIRDRAQRRRLADAAEAIREIASSSKYSTSEAAAKAEAALLAAAAQASVSEPVTLHAALGQYLGTLNEAQQGDGMVGLPTGIHRLDESTRGLRAGEVLVIAGRPGMGKSTLADQIAHHVAEEAGAGVLVFNLEMAAAELPVRPLARRLGRTEADLLRHIRSEWGQTEFTQAVQKLSSLPIWIDDKPGQSIAEIRAQARRWKLRHPEIGMLVIDYLQLVSAGVKCGSRAEEVAHVSRGVKILAKEIGVPVILLSQVSRELDKEKRRPRLADLRESGAVEQDADMVVFIHGAEETPSGAGDGLKTELLMAKCRRGGVGLIPVWFRRAWSRFEWREPDAEPQPEAQPPRTFAERHAGRRQA